MLLRDSDVHVKTLHAVLCSRGPVPHRAFIFARKESKNC